MTYALLFYMQVAPLLNVGVEGLVFGWRVAFGFQFIYACIMIVGFFIIPESPR